MTRKNLAKRLRQIETAGIAIGMAIATEAITGAGFVRPRRMKARFIRAALIADLFPAPRRRTP